MFIQTWKKYLPVIVFLMKRSIRSEQTLDMNLIDFERAAGGRKIKLNFSTITLDNGRTYYDAKQKTALVSDLIMVLQQSNQAEMLMQHQQFNFSMDINCQLTITNS